MLPAQENTTANWMDRAGVLRSLNRQEEAARAYNRSLEAFDRRIEKNRKDVESMAAQGQGPAHPGQAGRGFGGLHNATEASPQSYEAWWEKGQFLSSTGKITESMKAYDRAIELIPANETAQLRLAWADRTLELEPKNGVMWHFKAFILTKLDRKEGALAAFDGP